MSGINCECNHETLGRPVLNESPQPTDGRVGNESEREAPHHPTPRNINIKPLHYGYIVTVGCQDFAVEDKKKMLEIIGKYLENPYEMETKWMEKREF